MTLEASLVTADATTPVTVTACRNSVCGLATLPLPVASPDGGLTTWSYATLSDGFPASVSIASRSAPEYPLEILRPGETAALADGDVYSLTVTQGAQSLVTWSAPVTYTETFPDGRPCDAVPCRSAEAVATSATLDGGEGDVHDGGAE
jgi:hypothetical protein